MKQSKAKRYPDTAESGDTYDSEYPQYSVDGRLPTRKHIKQLGVKALLPIAIVACLVMSASSLALIYGANTQLFNVGNNLVSVSASYGFANLNGTVGLFPGDTNLPIYLQVNNGHRTTSNLQLTFNTTDIADFTPSFNLCNIVYGTYAITFNGQLINPANVGTMACGASNIPASFTYLAPVGSSKITVDISVANNANPNSFSLSWQAQPI